MSYVWIMWVSIYEEGDADLAERSVRAAGDADFG